MRKDNKNMTERERFKVVSLVSPHPSPQNAGKRKLRLRGGLTEPTLPATPPPVHPARQQTLCLFSA